MPRRKITLRYRKERCVLSDVLPYEVPISFTNRHFYDFLCEFRVEYNNGVISWKSGDDALNAIICLLFSLPLQPARIKRAKRFVGTIETDFTTYDVEGNDPKPVPSRGLKPFGYKIDHKEVEFRELTLPHPRSQLEVVAFYERYKELLLYFCGLSPFSIRKPTKISRHVYHKDRTHYERLTDTPMPVEQSDHEYEHIKSFFVYRDYSNVYKFYDSHKYHRCEKKYNSMLKLDISKCFDSIYTHSISWAVYGKEVIKENLRASDSTFPGHFDRLMQRLNYNETNGIVIGPEFSRLFAEIILQSVDRAAERELATSQDPLIHKVHYEIFRYVDDYFVFYNNEEDRLRIEGTFKHLLKEYGLHINADKAKVYSKPIITEISRAKRRITSLFDEHLRYCLEPLPSDHADAGKIRGSIFLDSKTLIVQFKTIIKECDVTYRELLNYTLAVLDTKIEHILQGFSKADAAHRSSQVLMTALIAVLEFVFFIYSVSPRATPTIKLCRILRMICGFARASAITHQDRHRVLKYIFDDICLILRKNKSDKHTQVETLYLLIALSELGKEYWLEEDVLASYFCIKRTNLESPYIAHHELSYFSLTVALFYMRSKSKYNLLRNCIENEIEKKFGSRSSTGQKEAELAFLLFDIIACPYVSSSLKHSLLIRYNINDPGLRQRIIEFKSPRSRHRQWFTIWHNFNYGRELDRKKGLEVY